MVTMMRLRGQQDDDGGETLLDGGMNRVRSVRSVAGCSIGKRFVVDWKGAVQGWVAAPTQLWRASMRAELAEPLTNQFAKSGGACSMGGDSELVKASQGKWV